MGKSIGTQLMRKPLTIAGIGWLALVILLSACNVESDYAKQIRREKETAESVVDAAVRARAKERVTELPPTAQYPHGLVELKLNGRLYRIPREYFFGRDDASVGEFLVVRWPNFTPLPDPIKQHTQKGNVITLIISAHDWAYQNPTDEEVETTIARGRNPPVPLKKYPELQEYPSDSPASFSRYRPIDPTVRRADGLRAYFYCWGESITDGRDPDTAQPLESCYFDLFWPDAVTMDLEFPRKHFKDWKFTHDRVMVWFESFRVLDVPTERLYPSYKGGTITVLPVEHPAFRLDRYS